MLLRRLETDLTRPFGPTINNLSAQELETFVLKLFVAYDEDQCAPHFSQHICVTVLVRVLD